MDRGDSFMMENAGSEMLYAGPRLTQQPENMPGNRAQVGMPFNLPIGRNARYSVSLDNTENLPLGLSDIQHAMTGDPVQPAGIGFSGIRGPSSSISRPGSVYPSAFSVSRNQEVVSQTSNWGGPLDAPVLLYEPLHSHVASNVQTSQPSSATMSFASDNTLIFESPGNTNEIETEGGRNNVISTLTVGGSALSDDPRFDHGPSWGGIVGPSQYTMNPIQTGPLSTDWHPFLPDGAISWRQPLGQGVDGNAREIREADFTAYQKPARSVFGPSFTLPIGPQVENLTINQLIAQLDTQNTNSSFGASENLWGTPNMAICDPAETVKLATPEAGSRYWINNTLFIGIGENVLKRHAFTKMILPRPAGISGDYPKTAIMSETTYTGMSHDDFTQPEVYPCPTQMLSHILYLEQLLIKHPDDVAFVKNDPALNLKIATTLFHITEFYVEDHSTPEHLIRQCNDWDIVRKSICAGILWWQPYFPLKVGRDLNRVIVYLQTLKYLIMCKVLLATNSETFGGDNWSKPFSGFSTFGTFFAHYVASFFCTFKREHGFGNQCEYDWVNGTHGGAQVFP